MNIINHFTKKSNLDIFKYLLVFGLLNVLFITGVSFSKIDLNQQFFRYLIVYVNFILLLLPFKILNKQKSEIFSKIGDTLKALKYSLLGYIIFIASTITIHVLKLNEIIPGFSKQENILEGLINSKLDMYVIGFAVCILAPLIEEIVFRGYIYNKFKNNYGVIKSSVLTSILFAGIHFQFQVFSAMFILSLIIHWCYEKSNGLKGAIAFHILNNTITFVLYLNL